MVTADKCGSLPRYKKRRRRVRSGPAPSVNTTIDGAIVIMGTKRRRRRSRRRTTNKMIDDRTLTNKRLCFIRPASKYGLPHPRLPSPSLSARRLRILDVKLVRLLGRSPVPSPHGVVQYCHRVFLPATKRSFGRLYTSGFSIAISITANRLLRICVSGDVFGTA